MRRGLAITLILFLALALLQIAAEIAGIQYFITIPWILAAFISLLTGPWPVLGLILGIVGAHYGWGWSWISAFMLFLGLMAVAVVVGLGAGVFGILREWFTRKQVTTSRWQSPKPETPPQKPKPQNQATSDEATFYGMLKVAETLRVAYARVVERKGGFVMAESELPATKEKIKAALLLCAHVAKLNGHLDEKMFNAVKMCYSSLADFIADEDRARRARKWRDYLQESLQESNPDNLPWPASFENFHQRIERGEIDARALLQKDADKMQEIGPVDGLMGLSPGFGSLCDEFEERLNALGDPQRRHHTLIEGQRIKDALLGD